MTGFLKWLSDSRKVKCGGELRVVEAHDSDVLGYGKSQMPGGAHVVMRENGRGTPQCPARIFTTLSRCDRRAVSTPFAAKRNCLGSPRSPSVAVDSALSTEIRQSARFPSLHKDTTNG